MTPSERALLKLIVESGKPTAFSQKFLDCIGSFDTRSLVFIMHKLLQEQERFEKTVKELREKSDMNEKLARKKVKSQN